MGLTYRNRSPEKIIPRGIFQEHVRRSRHLEGFAPRYEEFGKELEFQSTIIIKYLKTKQ